jgi:hypothetical protein
VFGTATNYLSICKPFYRIRAHSTDLTYAEILSKRRSKVRSRVIGITPLKFTGLLPLNLSRDNFSSSGRLLV